MQTCLYASFFLSQCFYCFFSFTFVLNYWLFFFNHCVKNRLRKSMWFVFFPDCFFLFSTPPPLWVPPQTHTLPLSARLVALWNVCARQIVYFSCSRWFYFVFFTPHTQTRSFFSNPPPLLLSLSFSLRIYRVNCFFFEGGKPGFMCILRCTCVDWDYCPMAKIKPNCT